MKSLFNRSLLFILAASAVSCMDESKPNYQYMPNMYEEVSYEPYGEYEIFANGQSAQLPAEGSIPRGWMPYDYENTEEGYQAAKAELQNPLPYTEENAAKGKALYTIYCAVCHGDQGDGQGILAQREKFLGIPRYDDVGRAITQGSIYHVQYYGRNAMGSYASQTSIEERWLIAHYVMDLKTQLTGGTPSAFEAEGADASADTTATNGTIENLIPAVNAEGDILEGESSADQGQENQNEE